MQIKNFHCSLNMPEKIKGDKDSVNNLPPYAVVKHYKVEDYKSCPTNWIHGSDIASSYFVCVKENHGMWLDFNQTVLNNYEHDVAIVISIQGINPITGLKTDKLRLEQYKKKCPVHNVDFESDSFCPECKFNWPSQNYLCTTGTPSGRLWLDGFRTSDGKVRQYYFTSEELKGIASQIIGDERVYAIGIAFYLSKNKVKREEVFRIRTPYTHDYWYGYYGHQTLNYDMGLKKYGGQSWNDSRDMKYASSNLSDKIMCSCCRSDNENDYLLGSSLDDLEESKILEIGAGSLINQEIYADTKDIDYWEEKPSGLIYINYCDEVMFNNIMNGGERKKKKNGFLNDLTIG